MKPQKINATQEDLWKSRLSNMINPKDPLKILADTIAWNEFDTAFEPLYKKGNGHPPKPIRLIVGLLMLEHIYGFSDEKVVAMWANNPYWQYFCGYDHFHWELPLDASSLVRWRKRLGAGGMEKILKVTIQEAVKIKLVNPKALERVIVDTTVMEKNIAHPTDSRLLNTARKKLVKLAKEQGIVLRQSYHRLGKRLTRMVSSYAHAKQFKRMKRTLSKLKTYLGRVVRDIERKLVTSNTKQEVFSQLLSHAHQLLSQTKKSKNKLYSLHEPSVYCVAKGKASKPYEFGSKVSLVVTHQQGLVLSSQALEKPYYDGHTLSSSLSKAEQITGRSIHDVFVDKGYRGHGIRAKAVYHPGQRKRLTTSLRRALRRRSSIEAHIGHMKSDGKLGRNYLKGVEGDKINALLCAVGHNMRMLLAFITSFLLHLAYWLFGRLLDREKVIFVSV